MPTKPAKIKTVPNYAEISSQLLSDDAVQSMTPEQFRAAFESAALGIDSPLSRYVVPSKAKTARTVQ